MLFEKDFYSLTADDLRNLVEYKVSEDKMVDFKEELPGNSDSDVKEFLADVSSFANASGGMIFYGVSEEEGVAAEICGVVVDDVEKEILRLQNTITSNIKPRLTQLVIRNIEVDDKQVILIRIPSSWTAPHVVNYKNRWRFYVRTSAGKHPMDIDEVREKMLQSNLLAEKMQQFREERLDLISGGGFPVKSICNSQIAIHLIPFSGLISTEKSDLNFEVVPDKYFLIKPLNSSVANSRYNLEGYINYGNFREDGSCSGYVQVFRNGIIESVNSSILCRTTSTDAGKYVPSVLVENEIIEKVSIYLSTQKKMGVLPPIALFLSIINIRGYFLAVDNKLDRFGERKYIIKRRNIYIPELIFDDFPTDIPTALKPLFDTLWNAFGWKRSFSYDENGKWLGGK